MLYCFVLKVRAAVSTPINALNSVLLRIKMHVCSISREISLGNPSKDRQRFVDAVVLISCPHSSVNLSNFENLLETPYEFGLRMLGFARLEMD